MRVAVVGAGIAGLGATRWLAGRAEVEVFEAAPRAGGHALTVDVDGTAVDVGFLVFAPSRYPRFSALLAELGVATRPTDMSFSSACARCGLEFGTTSLAALFAQPWRLLSPRHWRLGAGILAFQRLGRRELAAGPIAGSLAELVERARVPADVVRHFILPLAASLWSASPSDAASFAADPVLRFFSDHGMLAARGAPAWRTMVGGSQRYVDALLARLPATVHLGAPVRSIRREGEGAIVDGRRFDAVVLAIHADRALRLLEDPSEAERRALGAFRFGENEAVLHEDEGFLPRGGVARASWNHRVLDCARASARVEVTYDVSRLMRLPGRRRFLVTLNPSAPPARALARFTFDHPRLDLAAVGARAALDELQGRRATWYCGAWLGAGFHEDGLASAERVGAALLASERRAA